MNFNAVIPEFIVSNIEQSRSFYCDLLGFTIEYGRPEENFLFLSLEECQLMIEEGSKEELAELTYPFGRGVNISFGIKDVPRLYQKVIESNYPIHRPLIKRKFRVGDQVNDQGQVVFKDTSDASKNRLWSGVGIASFGEQGSIYYHVGDE